MKDEFREQIHYANVGLAMTIPCLIVGVVLIRDASEGVQQAVGVFLFFLPFALAHGVEKYDKRRKRRDQ